MVSDTSSHLDTQCQTSDAPIHILDDLVIINYPNMHIST